MKNAIFSFFFVLTIKMAQVFKKINKKIFLTFFDDFFRDLNRKSNFSQNISIFRGSRYHFRNRLIKSNKKKTKIPMRLRFIVWKTLFLFSPAQLSLDFRF